MGTDGFDWRYSYGGTIRVSGSTATVARPDGKVLTFALANNVWNADSDVNDTLVQLANSAGWLYTTSDGVIETYDSAGNRTGLTNRTGLQQTFTLSDGTTGANGGYLLDANGNPTATTLPANYLIRVTDASGRSISLGYGYDSSQTNIVLVKMTDPEGGVYLYGYDANDNLTSVTYPDGAVRQYSYTSPTFQYSALQFLHLLTGITDEDGVPYAAYDYDTQGRAVGEHLAPDAGLPADQEIEHSSLSYTVDASYGNPLSTDVTDPLNTTRTYHFTTILGVVKSTGVSQPGGSGCDASTSNLTYDLNGNVTSRADFNGNQTCYAYDTSRNLETARLEGVAAGTACPADLASYAPTGIERKITTAWHPDWRLPVQRAEPLKITTWVYNGQPDPTNGNAIADCDPSGTILPNGLPIAVLCKKIEQATTDPSGGQGLSATPTGPARIWTYTYAGIGQGLPGEVATVDGPRTDVSDITTYTYYTDTTADHHPGDLATVTNALGQVTHYTAYDGNGRILSLTDPNGLVTQFTYDPRGRLISKDIGGETTAYTYDPVGNLKQVTLPDGATLNYTYDDAHRMTQVEDGLGDKIVYTLDAMGNRTQEDVEDPSGNLTRTRSRVYDALDRLYQSIDAEKQTTTYAYDANGNLTKTTDPLTHVTAQGFDALNRLIQVTDPGGGETKYTYNGQDQLTQVTDPRNLVTAYTVNGLGERTVQNSPDSGTTQKTYNAAGNLIQRTDAKGQTTTYAYDALGRVTQVTDQDGSQVLYTYDQGTNGLGHLSGRQELDATGNVLETVQYQYDLLGRITQETDTLDGVAYTTAYGYDSQGDLMSLTYPDGRQVAYSRNSQGQIASLYLIDGPSTQILASNIQYAPFGGLQSYTNGAGQVVTRSYDQDGRVSGFTLGSQDWSLQRDAAGRVTELTDQGSPILNYGYDDLDRLTSAVTSAHSYSYAYDPNGNRTSLGIDGISTTYSVDPDSNRVLASSAGLSQTFDANGSLTDKNGVAFTYDTKGRMDQAGGAQYQVDAQGRRVLKHTLSGDTWYHYDLDGHLISESDDLGDTTADYIWLGDTPLAVLK